MSQAKSTFWVYEDYQGIHHIVDSLEKVPPSLKNKAMSVEVTPEEAEALRQAQPSSQDLQGYSSSTLDNGNEYADKLPPGITADTMAGAGIFLLALVFLRRLAVYYGYKTFARIASIAIFTMALGVVWTAARVVIQENAADKQEQTQENPQQEPNSD